MSKSIIQQLMDNEKPFGLMSEEMQEKARGIGRSIFERYTGWIFQKCEQGDGFAKEKTYRLRPDYQPEQEIVECEIKEDGLGKFHYDRPDGITDCSLSTAVNYSDFIGFKFDSGQVSARAIKFTTDDTNYRYDLLVSGECKAIHATHVLFRRQK